MESKMIRKQQLITLLFPLLDIIAPSTAFIYPRLSINSLSPFSIGASFDNDFIREDDDIRDIDSLLEWVSDSSIRISPLVSLSPSHKSNDVLNYGMVLNRKDDEDVDQQSSFKNNALLMPLESKTVLEVPRSLVLDSQEIHEEWKDILQPSLQYIDNAGFSDGRFSFVLMVKILREYYLPFLDREEGGSSETKKKSVWHGWIQSLPKKFNTGVCMNDVELSCLPPFSKAMADYERKRLEIFREALRIFAQQQKQEASSYYFFDECVAEDDAMTLWAFNVVSTRCWWYEDARDENSRGDIHSLSAERPIMVPIGDMFNHCESPNIYVEDSSSSDAVKFTLMDNFDDEPTNSKNDLFLSYGVTTNPHRFLIRFGFPNTQMSEVFCNVLYSNPSQEMINLGCNDRTKMVYRTKDGAVANAVWDTALYSLLDQVTEDQALFYNAQQEGDKDMKAVMHEKYVIETSLILRKHVVNELAQLGALLRKGAFIFSSMSETELEREHPRLSMIQLHNAFLFETFDKVRQGIDQRIQAELKKRREASELST